MKLKDRRALITGASLGLGRAIAEACLREGAHLFLCARHQEALAATGQALRAAAAPGQTVEWAPCDVASLDQVEQLIATVDQKLGPLDILVNNAGIYGPKGPTEEVPWDEWRQALEINLYGVMHLSRAVIPPLKKRGGGKIINLSGGGATTPLPFISAYAVSKAAVVRLTETLAEELRAYRIDVNAVAPGALNTRLLAEVLAADPEKVGAAFHARALRQQETGGTPLDLAANLCVFLASGESDGITGKLISAPWDPWEKLPEHLEEISTGDIYTLRRIVPKDRGKTWGDRS